jgi:putative ATPase
VGEQPGLFDADQPPERSIPDPGRGADAPLASRLRPRGFDELVGQEAVVPTLRGLAESGRLPSLVLWGPPGSGKTTLAVILAGATGSRLVRMSAVTAGVADLRKAIAEAAQARRQGRRTVLFIDELHRFNKAQQDAILPHVEDGTVTLIGATTENPSFEVISALLSRSRVFRLEPLTPEDLERVARRGLDELGAEIEPQAMTALLEAARGDARIVLNALEAAATLAAGKGASSPPTPALALEGGGTVAVIRLTDVEQAMQERHLLYDRAGDMHYDVASALIKSVRGSDPDAAVYWLARMLEAGEDVNFVARRLVISAAEDVGLADPMALSVAIAAQQAAHLVGLPEARLPLSEAAIYLARAPKSNSAYRAYGAASEAIRQTGNLPVPLHLRNAVTGLMRHMGYGRGYRYAHDYEEAKVDQQHLPDELKDRRFYEPTDRDR